MKHITAIALLLALGCSEAEDQDAPDLDTAGDEIDVGATGGDVGTVEEAISIGTNYGFTNASTHLACATPGTSGQNCFITGSVGADVKYCFGSGFTTAQKTQMKAGISAVDSLIALNFTEVFTLLGVADCEMEIDNLAVDTNTTRLMDHYTTFSPQFLTTLASGAGVSHVNGTWRSFAAAQCNVAGQKLDANFTQLDKDSAYQQIGGHLAGMMAGLGVTTPLSTSFMRRSINVSVLSNTLTSGEVCRANARNSASPTTVQWVTSCGT